MRSNKTKEQIFQDGFALFVKKPIPTKIFNDYMNDTDGTGAWELQLWIVNNTKDSISDWITGVGIIESVEHLYKIAHENGNLAIGMPS